MWPTHTHDGFPTNPCGTMAYILADHEAGIAAFFGSRAEWPAIGNWSTLWPPRPEYTPSLLDHGYDESKHPSEWTALDYLEAAGYRGCELLSTDAARGDVASPLTDGHWSRMRAGCRRLRQAGGTQPVPRPARERVRRSSVRPVTAHRSPACGDRCAVLWLERCATSQRATSEAFAASTAACSSTFKMYPPFWASCIVVRTSLT